MWFCRVVVACLLATPVAMRAQGPPPPPPRPPMVGAPTEWLDPAHAVAVSGVVVDATTGAPVAGAVVEVSLGGRPLRTDAGRPRTSDDRGRFVFDGLPPGDMAVRASAIGFLSSGFAPEDWSSFDRFPARAGEWVSDVRIALARPAVIAGTVLDERGEPVAGVNVGVLERVHVAGADHYMSGRAAVTDDRGRYRIIDLTPGNYIVVVPGSTATMPVTVVPAPWPGTYPAPPPDRDEQRLTYPAMFHPAATAAAQAQVVSVRPGDIREGIDVRLEPARATRVTGVIDGPADWFSGIAVRLVPETGGVTGAIETRTDATGRFEFERVPEGAYTLTAGRRWTEFSRGLRLGEPSLGRPSGTDFGMMTETLESGSPGLRLQTAVMNGPHTSFVRVPLVVSGADMTGIVATARPYGTLRGRVTREIDARHPVPNLHPAGGLRLDPADASIESGTPRSDVRPDDPTETFAIMGIAPGPFHLRSSFGWLIKSATWNGRDHARQPFDFAGIGDVDDVTVVVTNAAGAVSGTVRGLTDVTRGATVVLFPADPARWTSYGLTPVDIRRVSTAAEGRYTITGLPAGDYHVVAVPAAGDVDLHEDTFRRLRPQASTVTVGWGESLIVDLRVIGGQP